ncbi:hypothetical protein [Butyrivibrio sp. LB2008]|uniref:hypothetical protein n=1 Tax=Butyrivibrio sp. LB2008 TaxID=1408305 RepID=UPI00047D4902|nr:hypothetical protein [Butyrivibrio sp. LB2008]
MLENIKGNKITKVLIWVAALLVGIYVIRLIVAFIIVSIGFLGGAHEEVSDIADYDKAKLVEDNWDDMDSLFLIFPDNTLKIEKGNFNSDVKSDLISSYGYMILEACYEETDYLSEVERISTISYDLKSVYLGNEEHKIQKIKYDDTMYNYPAYIACDGYCGGYEYALLDENDNRIIYIHLSYPVLDELQDYSDYLKVDKASYKQLEKTSKENFTIYAYKFHEGSIAECSY